MTDQPTIAQILSDPRSADRAALDYCNEEVRNCLDKADALRDENAALWAFVKAVDASNECLDTEHWPKCGSAEDDVLAARVALDEYERSIG